MVEIYANIRDEVKKTAESIWNVVLLRRTPAEAVELLNITTEYYRHLYTEEEMEFLQFYFNLKMAEAQK